MGLRVAPELREDLVRRSADAGRSLTQELEILLQQGLLISKMMPGAAPILQVLMEFERAGKAQASRLGVEGDWTQNPDCFMPAALALLRELMTVCKDFPLAHWPGLLEQAAISIVRDRETGPPGGFVERTEPADGITATRELTDAELAKFDAKERLPVRRRPAMTPQRDENE
jgi:hypothetical protein